MLPEQCVKCGYPAAIKKMKAKGMEVKIKFKCPNGHEKEFRVPANMQHQWLNQAVRMIYRCDKCGTGPLRITQPESEDHYVEFYVVCPRDGERKRKIDETIYYAISSAQGAAQYGQGQPAAPSSPQSTPCTKCGSNLRWIEEYNRWYCDRCQQYL